MDKIIIVKNDDGSCAIIHPAPEMFDSNSRTRLELLPTLQDASDEEVLQYIMSRDIPEGKEYRVADLSAIPQDRFFRNAWTDDNESDTVDIDHGKAVEIKKNQLRELRKPLLSELDLAYMRADEAGNTELKAEIAEQKQELRDVTAIEFPSDIEELKDFIPDILKG